MVYRIKFIFFIIILNCDETAVELFFQILVRLMFGTIINNKYVNFGQTMAW